MNIAEASKLMGISQPQLRAGILNGLIPVGIGFKTNADNSRYYFKVYPEKVKDWLWVNYRKECEIK